MKWLRLFGKREREISPAEKREGATPEANGAAGEGGGSADAALLELSRRLACGQQSVAGEVAEALTDREGYLHRWIDRLDRRGIDRPIPALPWIALVDALQAGGWADEIDGVHHRG